MDKVLIDNAMNNPKSFLSFSWSDWYWMKLIKVCKHFEIFEVWWFLIPISAVESRINRIFFLIFIKFLPWIEGQVVLDSCKCLFCYPPPFSIRIMWSYSDIPLPNKRQKIFALDESGKIRGKFWNLPLLIYFFTV